MFVWKESGLFRNCKKKNLLINAISCSAHKQEWESFSGVVYLLPRKSSTSGKGNGDRRIKMGAGDVANRVNQNHHSQPPYYWYSRQSHHLVIVQIHHHRSTTGKDQEVGTQNLCHQLSSTKKNFNSPFHVKSA
jgi:hypothetical protein